MSRIIANANALREARAGICTQIGKLRPLLFLLAANVTKQSTSFG